MINGEVLYHAGVAIMAATAVAAVVAILLLRWKKAKMMKQFDEEYGKMKS